MRLFKKSKEKFSCTQDKSGKVSCRSFREFEDGTRQESAGADFSFTASPECKPVADSVFENEEGALRRLEDKEVKILREKCKPSQKPADY